MSDTGPVVGGVLLAAGESERFDAGSKLLEPIDGAPMVAHVAQTAMRSSLDATVAVVGHRAAAVEAALSGFDIEIRHNAAYQDGQSTSVRDGVAYAREAGWDAALFLLGDMPFVEPATIDALVGAYENGDGSIYAPRYEGDRGNPVLFDSTHFETLAGIEGDRGGRELVVGHDGRRFVDVDDPGVGQDIDTRADLRAYM